MKTIATHPAPQHGDEATAIGTLLLAHREISFSDIIRTRDLKKLEDRTFVVDVGGVYDPAAGRFDHHQKDAPRRPNGQPYAAAGLVWKEWGPIAVEKSTDLTKIEDIMEVVRLVDERYIVGIDLADCGKLPLQDGVTTVSGVIAAMNLNWDEEPGDAERQTMAFNETIRLAKALLARQIRHAAGRVKARGEAAKIFDKEIGVLDQFAPVMEELANPATRTKFLVFPALEGGWRVQCVPPTDSEADAFKQRVPLPAAWAGLRGDELDKIVGMTGCVFCHKGRFIAGHETREGAVKMAELALGAA